MQKLLASAALAALLAAAPAIAQTTSNTGSSKATTSQKAASSEKLSHADQEFVKKAAEGGVAEVELGKLAQQKAQSPKVKQLAETIVKDHEAANSKLMSIASSKGVELAKKPDKEHQKLHDKLAKLSGTEFDHQYSEAMVKDHKHDIKEFDKQAKDGKDADVKSFASQTLPTLKEHLQMAEAAAKELNATQTSRATDRPSRGTTGSGSSMTSPPAPAAGGATRHQ